MFAKDRRKGGLRFAVNPGPDVDSALSGSGAGRWEQEDLSLEDAFIDYIAGGDRRLPFGSSSG